jgi:hypothetical protein
MRWLQKIFFLFLITVFCAPAYAATNGAANNMSVVGMGMELASCQVFNEADSGESEGEEKKEEEEEPDCE